MKEGTIKTVKYEYRRKECEECGEPATMRIGFLLENARNNPASSGYGGDDISYCTDAIKYCCNEHENTIERNPPDGMRWASTIRIQNNEDGIIKNLHYVCGWEEISSEITV